MPINIESLLAANPELAQIFLYNIVGTLVGGLLAPFNQEMQNQTFGTWQNVPLSPGELARLVIRGHYGLEHATAEAKQSGMSPDDFHKLISGTGNPPSPGELAEALRRKLIPEDAAGDDAISFRGGIREGDLQNKWADIVKALSMAIPSPSDALQAVLEGQIPEDEGRALFEQFGGDPEFYQMLFNTRGQSPTPNELLTLANRRIIPWDGVGPDAVSYKQGFLEGPWRNKWEESFRALGEYLPPPRTVTAMVHEGVLTDALALELWQKQGLSEKLSAAYLASAKHAKNANHRHLSLSIIEQLYQEQAISRADATEMIGDLGYDAQDVQFILSVTDLKRLQASINRGITTVHTNYVNHHIDRARALGALDNLGIASAQRDDLLSTWTIERNARVAVLTPTQIKKAAMKDPPLITPADALQRLVNFGYSQADAAIFLSL